MSLVRSAYSRATVMHDPVAVGEQEAGLVAVGGAGDALDGRQRVGGVVDELRQLAGVAGAALVLHQPGAGLEVARGLLGRGRLLARLRLRVLVTTARQHGRRARPRSRSTRSPARRKCPAAHDSAASDSVQPSQDGTCSSITPTRACRSQSSGVGRLRGGEGDLAAVRGRGHGPWAWRRRRSELAADLAAVATRAGSPSSSRSRRRSRPARGAIVVASQQDRQEHGPRRRAARRAPAAASRGRRVSDKTVIKRSGGSPSLTTETSCP